MTLEQIDEKRNQDKIRLNLFKEVAEANLTSFIHNFNNNLWDFRVVNAHKITNVFSEEEVRQLAINFFTKEVSRMTFENVNFYFDKKINLIK